MAKPPNVEPAVHSASEGLTFNAPMENIVSIMEAMRSSFSPASRRIIDYILSNRNDVVRMSITELANKARVSEAAVTKLCKQVGARGFQQVKLSLAVDTVKPPQFSQEELSVGDDVDAVNQKIFHANIQALRDTLEVIRGAEMARARDLILAADRVEIYGIGSAAPLAQDAQYRMKRIGLNAVVEVDSHKQAISAALAGPRTAVLTVSHSGATQETVSATRLAKESGAKTICITNFGKAPIHRFADVVLQTVARETQFRTEAMASRIAQLSIVDALIANLAVSDFDRSVKTIKHTFEVLSSRRF